MWGSHLFCILALSQPPGQIWVKPPDTTFQDGPSGGSRKIPCRHTNRRYGASRKCLVKASKSYELKISTNLRILYVNVGVKFTTHHRRKAKFLIFHYPLCIWIQDTPKIKSRFFYLKDFSIKEILFNVLAVLVRGSIFCV